MRAASWGVDGPNLDTLNCVQPKLDAREAVAAELDTTVRERVLALVAERTEFELASDSKGRLLQDCEELKEG
jgi:hypothetical protein